jgi:hypothetical protein
MKFKRAVLVTARLFFFSIVGTFSILINLFLIFALPNISRVPAHPPDGS